MAAVPDRGSSTGALQRCNSLNQHHRFSKMPFSKVDQLTLDSGSTVHELVLSVAVVLCNKIKFLCIEDTKLSIWVSVENYPQSPCSSYHS